MEHVLTQTGFEKLLATLDADREQAGRKYENLRLRLIKFFEWRNCATPDELADTVFDRLARKVAAGEQVQNVEAYAVTIAQFVLKEYLRGVERRQQLIEENPTANRQPDDGGAEGDEFADLRRQCLEKCLGRLDQDSRKLLIAYHDTEERTMIQTRRRLADSLNVSLNTLRIRVCRLKARLEDCTLRCCRENSRI